MSHQHDLLSVALAAVVCVVGSLLTVLLSRRMLHAVGTQKLVQLALTSLIAGTTIWSTHFIAMTAFDPGVVHGYEPVLTTASLVLAIGGMMVSTYFLSYGALPFRAIIAGALFGLTVAAMHYLGMQAYLVPGIKEWHIGWVALSVVMGMGFGAAGFHRIVVFGPQENALWSGVLLVLSICSLHFVGMGGMSIQADSGIAVPERVIKDSTLSAMVVGISALILCLGFTSFSIVKHLESEARNQLDHVVHHDALTNLPNRIWLTQWLTDFDNRMRQDETQSLALLTLDINLFREINEVHGQITGDAVMRCIGQRFSDALFPHEIVVRADGDEFVAIKSDFRVERDVVAFGERLSAALSDVISVGDSQLHISAAIGIATTLQDGRNPTELLQKSHLAMARSKLIAGRPLCFFSYEEDMENRDKRLLVNDLYMALERGEFELEYQLQNEMETLRPVGTEALLRWNHPTRGRVPPGIFIPLAEETGLIRSIGAWVLETACAEAATWDRPLDIAVNVAPQQLAQPSFVELVTDVLARTGLDPHRLELEVTEDSIIHDQAHVLSVMHQLRQKKVRIAMDDFGTGYSSLATLQAFPFDKIKIDRGFISDVHVNRQRSAIVRATLLLGSALDIPILAEGVEEGAELDFLRAEGCSAAQGYYFGKPMGREALAKYVRDDDATEQSA